MGKREIEVLAGKAIRGDKKAFEELCRCKQKDIIFSALTILGDFHAAEDVAQEVILSMFTNIRALKTPAAIHAWIQRIVQNTCYRFLRKRGRQGGELNIDDEAVRDEIVELDMEFLPEAYMENELLSDRLYEIVLALPPKRREAILMYYYEDMSYQEIADATGRSMGAVASNISRARDMIKDALEHDAEGEQTKPAALTGVLGSGTVGNLASTTVLGRMFQQQADKLVPAERLAHFERQWTAAFETMSFPVAVKAASMLNAALAAKVAAGVLGAALVVVGAAVLPDLVKAERAAPDADPGPYPYQQQVPSSVEGDWIKGREITFLEGDNGDNHVNPRGVALERLSVGDRDATWTITDANGETVAAGVGDDASAELRELLQRRAGGVYTLHFSLTDIGGNTVRLYRDFEVDPALLDTRA
ncbi:MAG: RNA polymerase sigma factor [Coriobacteriales bacterium]|jgi:RNA polymerase sigma-70 factor (ECF subfamily)|nr:RNA polymerase sigma factor [Coriobacteriales bacterium]